jgi:hypothetical protein
MPKFLGSGSIFDNHGYQIFQHDSSVFCHGYRPNFFAHLDCFGGSDNSNDDIFGAPFSISPLRLLGVGGTSSILVNPLLDLLAFCTFLGNVDLLGVNAVATLLADLRIVFLISHDRFLARYHKIDDATTRTSVYGSTSFGHVWDTHFRIPRRRQPQ